MRYRLPLLLMFVLCFVAISPAFGQWRDVAKWEVSPFVGFETSGSYPVTNSFTIGPLARGQRPELWHLRRLLAYGELASRIHVESRQYEF